jgi:hypothetical protein
MRTAKTYDIPLGPAEAGRLLAHPTRCRLTSKAPASAGFG